MSLYNLEAPKKIGFLRDGQRIHCESFVTTDPEESTACDAGGRLSNANTSRWSARAFVFAIHHPDISDALCEACVAHVRMLVAAPTLPAPHVSIIDEMTASLRGKPDAANPTPPDPYQRARAHSADPRQRALASGARTILRP